MLGPTGATLAVTVQPANRGDTKSIDTTLIGAMQNLEEIGLEAQEVVADKGYHSNEVLKTQRQREIRTYISEPDRGRRNWKDKPAER